MYNAVFGNILRTVMVEENITPVLLAEKTGVTLKTIDKWLRGESYPTCHSLAKILLSASKYHYELAMSSAYKISRKEEIRIPYNFSEAFMRIVAEASISNRLGEEQRSKLFHIFEQISSQNQNSYLINKAIEDKSSVSELIILQKPKIVFLNDWPRLISKISRDHNELYHLNWKKFEDLMRHLLEEYGWDIIPMGYTKDDGIDLIAIKNIDPKIEFTMMVQCKRYRKHRKVGVSVVKDVWATKWEKGFHHAMIATTSRFTKGAVNKAESWKFDLRDHDSIVELCKEYGRIFR